MGLHIQVIDTLKGTPAPGIDLRLERSEHNHRQVLTDGTTDADGRFAYHDDNTRGHDYNVVVQSESYFRGHDTATCFPRILVRFHPGDDANQHHLVVLLSPCGYQVAVESMRASERVIESVP